MLFSNPLKWIAEANFYSVIGFHVVLGLVSTVTPFALILWFYFILINFIGAPRSRQKVALPYLLMYILPIELLGRMARAYPYIPTEMGKYLSIVLLIYGISSLSTKGRKEHMGAWTMLGLSLPSLLIVPFTFYTWRFEITYNYLGIFTLCLYVIYFNKITFYLNDLKRLFRIIVIGVTSVLAYSIIKSPEIDPSAFQLGASTEFTGGFGSNQVSTVLGLAIGIIIFMWLFGISIGPGWIMTAILGLSLVWSLLSFSRGGVVAAVLGIAGALMVSGKGRQKLFSQGRFFLIGVGSVVVFLFVNELTGGQLLLRYQGETYGTVTGHKEKNIDFITSNRSIIVENDFNMWMDNFLLGVGPGQSKKKRHEYGLEPVAPHVELTRLLSEHGFFGFLVALIWLFIPLAKITSERSQTAKSLLTFLFIIAFMSTMHSAMRTAISPLVFGFACARFRFVTREHVIQKRKEAQEKLEIKEPSEEPLVPA